MKFFLRKLFIFFSLATILFILLLLWLSYINNQALKNYKTAPQITELYVGDSHIQLGIDDKLLPISKNIAKPGEAIYYTFYKLGPILEKNPSIKKVYLGFSYHNISSYINDNIFGTRSKDIAARYFLILPFQEKINMTGHNRGNLPTFFRNILTHGFHTLLTKKNDYSFIGGYENNFLNTAANQLSMDKRIITQYYDDGLVRDFSFINIKYFNMIVELCKTRKIELVILNTPIHSYYKKNIPQKFIDRYNSIMIKTGLQQISFDGLQLSDSCFIADGDHLSEKGAQTITKFMAQQDRLR